MSSPHSRRRGRAARLALPLIVATLLAAVGLVFPLSSSASAVGYPITYTLTNKTFSTLSLKSARVGFGSKCYVNLTVGLVECPNSGNGKDFSGNVGPLTVYPNYAATVNYELDVLNFRVPQNFMVIYTIGTKGFVELHETGQTVKCNVSGTTAFTCVQTGQRDFVLQPA